MQTWKMQIIPSLVGFCEDLISKDATFIIYPQVPLTTSARYTWSIVTPHQETCKRPTKKSLLEVPEEENLHLYLDPLEDLINPPNNRSASPLDQELQEKMLVSPSSRPCKKQTTITGKKIFEQLFKNNRYACETPPTSYVHPPNISAHICHTQIEPYLVCSSGLHF